MDNQTKTDFMRASELTPEVAQQIDDFFTYSAWTEEQVQRGVAVRVALAAAVKAIISAVPPCPTRTVAIRKIAEARMDCNSAITHNGRY